MVAYEVGLHRFQSTAVQSDVSPVETRERGFEEDPQWGS
jgi:hypothetical protein